MMKRLLNLLGSVVIHSVILGAAWSQPPPPPDTKEPRQAGEAIPSRGESSSQPSDGLTGASDRPQLPVEPHWKRLSPKDPVWLDKPNRTVIVGGQVCHREGPIEMFACPRDTKEYESVVVVDCKSFMVHAALLAVGAQPGRPVEFLPEYRAAEGPITDVTVEWLDDQGERRSVPAQEWVKDHQTGKAMNHDWVFAGSGFWVDEETGDRHYHAEGGELICVSNFSTATLDLPIRSSQANAELMFVAFAEKIPSLGTPVYLKLTPRLPGHGTSKNESTAKSATSGAASSSPDVK